MTAAKTSPLLARIESATARMTRSERLLAAYLTAHHGELALETAASVARKVEVSPMTVGRFLRTLGYAGFDELRRDVSRASSSSAWHVGDRYEQFARGRAPLQATLSASLEREVGALVAVYNLATDARWQKLARDIAAADEVYVAGYQTVRGVAMDFAARLEYVRDRVRFLDGANGTYAELFASGGKKKRHVLLVDIRRYSRDARLLAQAASQLRVPLAVITDAHCHWARPFTRDVFHVDTEVGLFWDSNAGITSLLNLLTNAVIGHLAPSVEQRAKRLEGLQDQFGAFLD
ncbi:MAG TPA: MurR/RpiR family transcriptional regulator [Ramlibacter sp.]|jgi:DNA-binding MurR/RpiR family transcriptional regulator|nr:MurR/RpiR family transcriptional regulator [Ramlibacter sp.]